MMVRNDVQGRWVNGSIGKVEALSDSTIFVRFTDGKVHRVDPVVWGENKTYTWDQAAGNITFAIEALRAVPHTAGLGHDHSQKPGLTFDHIIIDMGRGAASAHGQLYVALSRCKTLNGITLRYTCKGKGYDCRRSGGALLGPLCPWIVHARGHFLYFADI